MRPLPPANRLRAALEAHAASVVVSCESCGEEIAPDSLWMSNEACYCSAICRRAGKEQAHDSGTDVERNGVQSWGEDSEARMARLRAAAAHDMELLQRDAEERLFS